MGQTANEAPRASCRIRSSVSTGRKTLTRLKSPFAPGKLSGRIVSHALNDVLGKAALCKHYRYRQRRIRHTF
jgi:hypothetical protein